CLVLSLPRLAVNAARVPDRLFVLRCEAIAEQRRMDSTKRTPLPNVEEVREVRVRDRVVVRRIGDDRSRAVIGQWVLRGVSLFHMTCGPRVADASKGPGNALHKDRPRATRVSERIALCEIPHDRDRLATE